MNDWQLLAAARAPPFQDGFRPDSQTDPCCARVSSILTHDCLRHSNMHTANYSIQIHLPPAAAAIMPASSLIHLIIEQHFNQIAQPRTMRGWRPWRSWWRRRPWRPWRWSRRPWPWRRRPWRSAGAWRSARPRRSARIPSMIVIVHRFCLLGFQFRLCLCLFLRLRCQLTDPVANDF